MRDVRHCILCGSTDLNLAVEGLLVSVSCNQCHAAFVVEYDAETPGRPLRTEINSRRKGPPRPE